MEIARKIGIGVVMVVPAFVGAGAAWDLFHSWFAVFVWLVLMALLYARMVAGKKIPAISWFAVFVFLVVIGFLLNRVLKSRLIPFFS